MLQHARFTFPNYAEGYCIDDNARALMLTVQLEKRGVGGEEIAARQLGVAFSDRNQCRQHDSADMQHRFAMYIVELEALDLRAIDQGRMV